MNQLINSFYPAVNNINQQFLKEYEYWGSRQEKNPLKIIVTLVKKKMRELGKMTNLDFGIKNIL